MARNQAFLTDLFAGPFRGHGLIMGVPAEPDAPDAALGPGDFTIHGEPVDGWLPGRVREYEAQCQYLEALDDDNVPTARLGTGTQVFAAAFGCPVAVFDTGSHAFAQPLVSTAQEADRLTVPSLDAPGLRRVFELGDLVLRELGPEAPIGVPDIQSPFDIAALVWHKQDFFLSLVTAPEAVHTLVAKCEALLVSFLEEFCRRYPAANLAHCPIAWAPPSLGCWLSEDEAGALSCAMFDEFCRPSLVRLSERFGGLFMHCCATADHQYANFAALPNLRGLNRVYQEPGAAPAVAAFSGQTVLMQAWLGEAEVGEFLDLAQPDTRYLFSLNPLPLEQAKPVYERLRKRCPRVG